MSNDLSDFTISNFYSSFNGPLVLRFFLNHANIITTETFAFDIASAFNGLSLDIYLADYFVLFTG